MMIATSTREAGQHVGEGTFFCQYLFRRFERERYPESGPPSP
jgi:hypothetical protein